MDDTEKAPKPVSVRLTAQEIDKLKKIAQALGVSEHGLRHFAIQKLIYDYEHGWRPQKRKKKVAYDLEVE